MRKIIHIDMDCFYAAVEAKHNPQLRGRPVGVGGPPESRSVLCTANYEARKFGVRAAMPSRQALKLCPGLILVPPRFALYKAESQVIQDIFRTVTDKVEPLSLDEAYLDVTNSSLFDGSASRLALHLRRQIWEQTGLSASAGIAPNKFLAKIASDWKKPRAQFTILPEQIDALMPTLPVEKLWGVGRVTAARLHQQGFFTCGDLQKLDPFSMRRLFGSRAFEMGQLIRGIDDRAVHTGGERKSLTVEETFAEDLLNWDDLKKEVPPLFESFRQRFSRWQQKDESSRIRGWVVKLKFADFRATTVEESSLLPPSEQDFLQLLQTARQRSTLPVRLIGLGVRLRDVDPDVERQLSFGTKTAF